MFGTHINNWCFRVGIQRFTVGRFLHSVVYYFTQPSSTSCLISFCIRPNWTRQCGYTCPGTKNALINIGSKVFHSRTALHNIQVLAQRCQLLNKEKTRNEYGMRPNKKPKTGWDFYNEIFSIILCSLRLRLMTDMTLLNVNSMASPFPPSQFTPHVGVTHWSGEKWKAAYIEFCHLHYNHTLHSFTSK